MSLHSRADGRPRRHDLVFVTADAWRALLAEREDLQEHAVLTPWIEKGWPLIGRRAAPGDKPGVPVGLPLPRSCGKRRLSFVIHPADVREIVPPPALCAISGVTPPTWLPTLDLLEDAARRHGVDIRVCGSLAWHALTRLDYVSERSDLDLLLYIGPDVDLRALTAELALIEAAAPMRLDGELIRADGAAASWREIHAGAREVLVKTVDGLALVSPEAFLSARVLP
jgi:phosphoribosyl-dephospho-CoA transferase